MPTQEENNFIGASLTTLTFNLHIEHIKYRIIGIALATFSEHSSCLYCSDNSY